MELNVNDTLIDEPTADDIARALSAPSYPTDWFIVLENDAGAMLDALAQPDGLFALTHVDENDKRRNATPNVDAAKLRTILTRFLAGDAGWRKQCAWRDENSQQPSNATIRADKLTGHSGREPPTWAIIVVVGAIGFVVLTSMFDQWESDSFLRSLIPIENPTYLAIAVIALPMIALVIAAIVNAIIETRRAASWTKTTGRIVRSEIEARRVGIAEPGEKQAFRNEAAIAYEFKANSDAVRGSRISISHEYVGANAHAAVARYRVGATVDVFYDPKDPRNCVLERGGPQGASARGCLGSFVALMLVIAAIAWIATRGPTFVATHFSHATTDAQFTVILAGVGLVLLIVSIGMRRKARAAANGPSPPENATGMAWYPLALAIGCFALAAWRAGLFG